MKIINKTYSIITLIIYLCLCVSNTLYAQQILNVTEIPHDVFDNREPRDIGIIDGKVIVPMYVDDNEIYEYLPHVEVDSFPTPEDVFSVLTKNIGGTFYAEYEPFTGFVSKDIVNYGWYEDLSFEGDYIAFSESTWTMGLNNNILHPFPTSPDTLPDRMNTIAVYDKSLDSFVYVNVFAEKRKYNLKSNIDGDYIYVNIPRTWEDQVTWGDLVFMGDTLTYDIATFWTRGSNYLSKINFKTGEKAWTRHIGYGDVHQIVVDDQHRINIEIETGAPAMYNMEWEDPNYDLSDYGTYDRLIYRMTGDGDLEDYTYIKTFGLPSIYEVEFNRDGSFQAFGLVQGPIFVHVEGDSLDFMDALSFDESKGLALVYDDNLDYKWGKKIISEGRTLVQAVNKNPNGDYVLATICKGKRITIDDQEFISPPLFSGEEILDQAILTRFDSEGNLLGMPVFSNHKIRIEDLQALGEHHYLLNVRKFTWYQYDFIDTSFYENNISYLIEYEGDIFDIMTSVEEYFAAEAIRISPNPAVRGGQVEVTLPKEDWNGGSATIQLYTIMGRAVDIPTTLYGSANITIPNNIAPGMYYMRIDYKNKRTTMPIYIQ